MVKTPEHRRVARLTVPRRPGGSELELRLVRLVNLSADGGCIEHTEPLSEGALCSVDLPPDLGRLRLTGRIQWTRLHGAEPTLEGGRPVCYHSGLAWAGVTPAQARGLAAALEALERAP